MEQKYSSGIRALLYILSFLFAIVGIIIGIVFLTRDDKESKDVGKICLIVAIVSIVVYGLCYVLGFAAMLGFASSTVKPAMNGPSGLPGPGG